MKNKLFENEFLSIDMINANYPFVTMKTPGIVIVPEYNGKVALICKSRLGKSVLEFPRGFGHSIEEIKTFVQYFKLDSIKNTAEMGHVQADTGVMNNQVSIVTVELAEDIISEDLIWVSVKELAALIKQDSFTCGYTLSAAAKYISNRILELL